MKRPAILAVAAVALIGTLAATAVPQSTAGPETRSAPPPQCSAKHLRPFSAAVWALERWRRGKPPKATIRAYRARLACAGPNNRKAMKHRWRADQHRFFDHRRHKLRALRHEEALNPPGIEILEAIAACESGGDPTAISADGTYRGKYQFDYATWAEVGGSGDPAAAPEWEQDERAAALYRERGSSPWPICG